MSDLPRAHEAWHQADYEGFEIHVRPVPEDVQQVTPGTVARPARYTYEATSAIPARIRRCPDTRCRSTQTAKSGSQAPMMRCTKPCTWDAASWKARIPIFRCWAS